MLTPKEIRTPMAEEEDEEDTSAATLSKIIEVLGKTYGFEVEDARYSRAERSEHGTDCTCSCFGGIMIH